jgi:hypothetical protein
MVPFREPFSHARKAASSRLCVGLQLKPIGQVFFRADFLGAYFRFLGCQKLFYIGKYTKHIFWTFLGPAATYRTGLFVVRFFLYIFDPGWAKLSIT